MCSVLGLFCIYIVYVTDLESHTGLGCNTLCSHCSRACLCVFVSLFLSQKHMYFCDSRNNELVLIAVEHGGSSCFWMPQTAIIQWQPNSGPGGKLNRSHLVLSKYIALYFEKALSTHAVLSFHCTTHSTLLCLCIACYIILWSGEWLIFYGVILIMRCLMGLLLEIVTITPRMDR